MTHFTAPAFIRSVARFTDLEAAGPKPAFSETLTHWLHWTDAGDLAAALEGEPADTRHAGRPGRAVDADDLGREVAAFREAMKAAIGQDRTVTSTSTPRGRQQSMETGVAALRARLRAALAARSPEMARLAAIDSVMERVLAPRERGLLAGVPASLAQHSDELHDVLQAELDLRLLPVEGLLAALEAAQASQASQPSQAAQAAQPSQASQASQASPASPALQPASGLASRAADGPALRVGRASRPART